MMPETIYLCLTVSGVLPVGPPFIYQYSAEPCHVGMQQGGYGYAWEGFREN
jgi:hypothetical protein